MTLSVISKTTVYVFLRHFRSSSDFHIFYFLINNTAEYKVIIKHHVQENIFSERSWKPQSQNL